MSCALSVSAATSFSAVRKKTREPSCEAAGKVALLAPLPPVGPVRQQRGRAVRALVDVHRGVGVGADERLVRLEEDAGAVRRRAAEDGGDGAVARRSGPVETTRSSRVAAERREAASSDARARPRSAAAHHAASQFTPKVSPGPRGRTTDRQSGIALHDSGVPVRVAAVTHGRVRSGPRISGDQRPGARLSILLLEGSSEEDCGFQRCWLRHVRARRCRPQPARCTFPDGVASGDVTSDARDSVDAGRRGRPTSRSRSGRTRRCSGPKVFQGKLKTSAARDYTVKIDATGLQPDTQYWYRFKKDADVSAGRARSRPRPAANSPADVKFTYTGDSDVTKVGGVPPFNNFETLTPRRTRTPTSGSTSATRSTRTRASVRAARRPRSPSTATPTRRSAPTRT